LLKGEGGKRGGKDSWISFVLLLGGEKGREHRRNPCDQGGKGDVQICGAGRGEKKGGKAARPLLTLSGKAR